MNGSFPDDVARATRSGKRTDSPVHIGYETNFLRYPGVFRMPNQNRYETDWPAVSQVGYQLLMVNSIGA